MDFAPNLCHVEYTDILFVCTETDLHGGGVLIQAPSRMDGIVSQFHRTCHDFMRKSVEFQKNILEIATMTEYVVFLLLYTTCPLG